jgi:NHL repeat
MNYPITSLLAGLAFASTAFGKGIPNNAAADLVLGQPNFTTNTFPTPLPSANSLRDPRGVAIDSNTGKVFISDSANNRILRYSGTALSPDGKSPETGEKSGHAQRHRQRCEWDFPRPIPHR